GTVMLDDESGQILFTPAPGFVGTALFTYRVADAQGALSNAASVMIIVEPAGVPIAVPDEFSGPEGEPIVGNVLENDLHTQGGNLAAVLVDAPEVGELTLNPDGSFVYEPAENVHGSVTFTYRATDGISQSEPATVTITVIASPQVPVAAPDTFTINEDMVVFGNVLTNDSDPQEDTLTAVLVDEPESG